MSQPSREAQNTFLHELPDLIQACCHACRYEDDQTFSALQATDLETMDVVDGTWYVYLKGDYAGRVSGAVYDYRNTSDPVKLVTTVSTWHVTCISISHLQHRLDTRPNDHLHTVMCLHAALCTYSSYRHSFNMDAILLALLQHRNMLLLNACFCICMCILCCRKPLNQA